MENSFEDEFKPPLKKIKTNPPKKGSSSAKSNLKGLEQDQELFRDMEILYKEINDKPSNPVITPEEKPKRGKRSSLNSKKPSTSESPGKANNRSASKRGGGRRGKKNKADPNAIVEEPNPPSKEAKPQKEKQRNKKKVPDEQPPEPERSKARKAVSVPPPVAKDNSPEEAVLDYLRRQNRPYSVINVFDNLHGKIKKPDLEKILGKLAKDGKIIEKDYGKSSVYWYNQALIETNQQVLETEKEKYIESSALVDQLKKDLAELKAVLAKTEKIPTTESFRQQIKTCTSEIPVLEQKLQRYKDKAEEMVSPEVMNDLEFKLADLEKIKNRRKKIFNNMIDTLLESTNLPKKKLFEKIGLE